MWFDARGFLWISSVDEVSYLLSLVLGVFAIAHIAIARQRVPNPRRQRLGESLVRAEVLSNRELQAKPLRFNPGLRLDSTSQHSRVQKVRRNNHLPRTSSGTSGQAFRYRWASQAYESRLYGRRLQAVS